MDNFNGFCVADNIQCNKLLKESNSKDLNKTKIFGQKIPSMETFFHCFMKKYTVHIHFTLSNIFLTTKCLGYLLFIPLNQVQIVEGLKEKGIERSRSEFLSCDRVLFTDFLKINIYSTLR